MTRVTEFPGSRTRRSGLRAAVLAGVTVAAAAALSACGTGQVNQTAYMQPTVSGVNQTFNVTGPDDIQAGSIALRNLAVSYNGAQGYRAGGDAPLEVGIFNGTSAELKVTVTAPGAAKSVSFKTGTPIEPSPVPSASVPPQSGVPAQSQSAAPSASGSAKPRTSAKASPSPTQQPTAEPQPPSGPATLTIPAGQFLVLSPAEGKFLVLQGLAKDLKPGDTVDGVTFQFQLSDQLQVVEQPTAAGGPSPSFNPSSCLFDGGNAVCRAPVATPHEPQPRVVPTGATHE